MNVLSVEEIMAAEAKAFDSGKTELGLMKMAGKKCADVLIKHFDIPNKIKNAVIACGNGKNGGDGFVIAMLLNNMGCNTKIVLVDQKPSIDECVIVFDEAKSSGVPVEFFSDSTSFNDAQLIVDCIFGVGFHGTVKSPFHDAMTAINGSSALVACIDVPSGTDSTCGTACEQAIKGDLTIAISALKYCHILPPSNELCGKVKTVDIGIEKKFLSSNVSVMTKKSLLQNFSRRKINSNKGDYGKILSLCGSYKMPGAAVISAIAAVNSGAGLVTCAFPKSAYSAIASNLIPCTFLPLSENEDGQISENAIPFLLDKMKTSTVLLAGCGLGIGKSITQAIKTLIHESNIPIVLDADGINAVVPCINILRECKVPLVITPHPGEMARIVGESVDFVQQHRLDVARQIATAFEVVVVLKGANTIVTDGNNTFVCTKGNAGMAKGGTGDMLAGMTAAFIAQGMTTINAAVSSVFIHAQCGDICAREISQRGMTVLNMLEILPALLKEYEN